MNASTTGPLRMLSTLGAAGLCSGLAVVGIFLATKPRIERNRAEALEAAIFRVLPGATARAAFALRDGDLVRARAAPGTAGDGEVVYAGYDAEGDLLGYAIPAEGPGFQDTIKLLYGFDAGARRVVGMEVLESRETPGLGDRILHDPAFGQSFRDLAVDPQIVLVKNGRSHANEVDGISGATISSNAVVRIINEANGRWSDRLAAPPPEGGSPGKSGP